MTRHERLRDQLGMRTYFCGPHSPLAARRHRERQQRAPARRPQACHPVRLPHRDLGALLWAFNTTPRKRLAFQTPLEAFDRQLGVALET
jgi:transposase, IS30 family